MTGGVAGGQWQVIPFKQPFGTRLPQAQMTLASRQRSCPVISRYFAGNNQPIAPSAARRGRRRTAAAAAPV
jgi:hypothetical protein